MSYQEALLCLADLDRAVLSLIPRTPVPNVQEVGIEAISDKAQHLSRLAAKLHGLFDDLKLAQTSSQTEQRQQEVAALKEELQLKDDLLQECQRKLEAWRATCTTLTDVHHQNLFKDFTQAPRP